MVTEKMIEDVREKMKKAAAEAYGTDLIEEPHCPICGREILAHTKCIRKERGHGPSKD